MASIRMVLVAYTILAFNGLFRNQIQYMTATCIGQRLEKKLDSQLRLIRKVSPNGRASLDGTLESSRPSRLHTVRFLSAAFSIQPKPNDDRPAPREWTSARRNFHATRSASVDCRRNNRRQRLSNGVRTTATATSAGDDHVSIDVHCQNTVVGGFGFPQ